jgi:hypothetical protein
LGATNASNYNSKFHTINGGLDAGGTGSSDEAKYMRIGANAYTANHGGSARTTGLSGGSITFNSRTSDSSPVISFNANLVANGPTTDATLIGSATATGAWTLGPASGLGTAAGAYHTYVGSVIGISGSPSLSGNTKLELGTNFYRDGAGTLKANTGNTGVTIQSTYTTGTPTAVVWALETNTTAQTANAGVAGAFATVAQTTAAGAWTIGPLSFLGTHTIRGNVDQVGNIFTQYAASTAGVIQVVSTVASGDAELKANASGASGVAGAYLTLAGNGNSNNYINSAGSRSLIFIENAVTGTHLGSMGGGAWTFGPTSGGGSLVHKFQATLDTTVRVISGAASTPSIEFYQGGNNRGYMYGGPNGLHFTAILPNVDNTISCGAPSFRFTTIYGVSGVVNTSDLRLKDDVEPLDKGLAEVMALQPKKWTSKFPSYQVGTSGFVAQDLEQVLPEMVKTETGTSIEGIQDIKTVSVCGPDMVAILVKAIQELKAELDDAKARIAALEA